MYLFSINALTSGADRNELDLAERVNVDVNDEYLSLSLSVTIRDNIIIVKRSRAKKNRRVET